VNTLIRAGRYLFRRRAVIATIAFVPLILAARPDYSAASHILVFCGLAIRIWAAVYIGPGARKHEFLADHIIKNGPYRLLKHPLYIGNFFLVSGVLIMYNPPRWLSALYIGLFLIIYATILFSELHYLKGKPKREERCRLTNLSGEVSTWIVLAVVYFVYFLLGSLNK
jgi:protein-S-isoprenylcysteine O-methyltransferase Ste14